MIEAQTSKQQDAVIVGASFDTPKENKAFAEAEGFPFKLLADEDRSVGRSYDVGKGARRAVRRLPPPPNVPDRPPGRVAGDL